MAAKPKPKFSQYVCGVCRRRLKVDRWVYSTHTGNRYCLPGEGCQKRK
jgi:hypothetical protein